MSSCGLKQSSPALTFIISPHKSANLSLIPPTHPPLKTQARKNKPGCPNSIIAEPHKQTSY